MTTALIAHRDTVLHEISPGHPECPQRIDAIGDRLIEESLFDLLSHHEAPLATRSSPWTRIAWRAATTMLPKRQKPIARVRSAW